MICGDEPHISGVLFRFESSFTISLGLAEPKPETAQNGKCEGLACVSPKFEPTAIAKTLSRGQSPESRTGVQLQWGVPKIAEGDPDSKEVKCASERVRMVRAISTKRVHGLSSFV